jgi:hypothetical protein
MLCDLLEACRKTLQFCYNIMAVNKIKCKWHALQSPCGESTRVGKARQRFRKSLYRHWSAIDIQSN